ncbi:hypothetical protein KW842_10045 [Duganella sp. sic0402]|uniref:type IV pilus assembly protein FimV n=1 Tax=Duganella sp. sic0402 TaxID=2854786 RepID=UPI001C43A67F|nr:hypothetical protein [Duganella sp. sic0402]MBV7536105.1 hypothetical protein [Duganella sp. sic0402]
MLICSWLGAVQAAELGDVAPRSYIGQPLAVDIDLLSLTPEEVAGLQVRLADVNVYRGANVAMNPALASARLQVERRGQKPVLHVTTTRAVEADYLHLYVQLGAPGKQEVRLATVWLQHDPNPAPPPQAAVPLAGAMTPAQAEQIAAQARAARVAAARETASKEAAAKEAAAKAAAEESARQAEAAAAPVRDRSKPAPLPSMHEAETGAPGEVKAAAAARRIAGVWVTADGKQTRAPTSADPAPVPVGVAQALLPLAPLPLPKGVKRPAQASCAPTGMSAKECLALDAHNAELSSKLTELEGKMKALQGALGGAGAASAQPSAPVATRTAVAPGAAAAATSAPAAGSKAASANSAPGGAAPSPVNNAASSAAAVTTVASAGGKVGAAGAASHAGAATSASASLSARSEPEAHAAKAAAGEGASAGAAASTPPVATKQVRVLPKLKYKKEKPPEPQADYTLPLAAGGVGLLALLGAGLIWWRKKKSGKGPLKIWQGFRKKKAPEPEPEEFVEVKTAAQ